MPNRISDPLHLLVSSLTKSEKRHFKLYLSRHTDAAELNMTALFDAFNGLESYDEATILRRAPGVKKSQLSNAKAHLYRQILTSLRLLNRDGNVEVSIQEGLQYAGILQSKGLYALALQTLQRTKNLAAAYHQHTYRLQALVMEKKIESQHITRSMQDRADGLVAETEEVTGRLQRINAYSNLALQLYGWYIRHGNARHTDELSDLRRLFRSRWPDEPVLKPDFYERLYRYQCYTWYYFIQQSLPRYYRATHGWVQLFEQETAMLRVEPVHYIKGIHNLLNAHFLLGNGEGFAQVLQRFEYFVAEEVPCLPEGVQVQAFVYLYVNRINRHFIEGSFEEGLALVPQIEAGLLRYTHGLDRHRVLVFYYKIASLYFGAGHNDAAIDYLNRIIHWKVDLRTDLQCYARLLHLIAHYELGNDRLLEYLIKSVYRFMAKMQALSTVEREILVFLRKAFYLRPRELRQAFEALHARLAPLQSKPQESRSFMYLDVVSWLESKMQGVSVGEVRRRKYMSKVKS